MHLIAHVVYPGHVWTGGHLANLFTLKAKRLLKSANLGYAVPMSLQEKLLLLEKSPSWKSIKLPDSLFPEIFWEVLVEETADGQLRIANSPGMIMGLAADDIVVLDGSVSQGYRLIKRGQNVVVHIYVEADRRETVQRDLSIILGKIGGELDGHMGENGLCYTIPVAAGFGVMEGELNRVVPGKWFYSNVHDPETDEPLNWWLKK